MEVLDLTGDDGVQVLQPAPKRPRPAPEAVASGDDGDVMCLGVEEGPGCAANLPHGRPDCRKTSFVANGAPSNAATCAACYCYVCDCPWAACAAWAQHADAHAGDPRWRAARQAARGPPPAAAPAASMRRTTPAPWALGMAPPPPLVVCPARATLGFGALLKTCPDSATAAAEQYFGATAGMMEFCFGEPGRRTVNALLTARLRSLLMFPALAPYAESWALDVYELDVQPANSGLVASLLLACWVAPKPPNTQPALLGEVVAAQGVPPSLMEQFDILRKERKERVVSGTAYHMRVHLDLNDSDRFSPAGMRALRNLLPHFEGVRARMQLYEALNSANPMVSLTDTFRLVRRMLDPYETPVRYALWVDVGRSVFVDPLPYGRVLCGEPEQLHAVCSSFPSPLLSLGGVLVGRDDAQRAVAATHMHQLLAPHTPRLPSELVALSTGLGALEGRGGRRVKAALIFLAEPRQAATWTAAFFAESGSRGVVVNSSTPARRAKLTDAAVKTADAVLVHIGTKDPAFWQLLERYQWRLVVLDNIETRSRGLPKTLPLHALKRLVLLTKAPTPARVRSFLERFGQSTISEAAARAVWAAVTR